MSVFLGPGMPSASLLVNLLSALLILFVFGETEIRFTGQTEFVVNETSTTVIRLIIERIGEPANVTAIVSLYGEDAGDFFDTYAAAFIPAGETNRTVYIAVCDDDLPEPDETFIFHLTLQKPSANVKLGWPRTVTVTILSNDNAFGIISFNMLPSIAVSEPKGRNESMPLTLIREKGTYGMVMVTFEVEGGPNPPDEDLSPVKGNITFPPGRATVIYNLTVLDDEVPENDEIFLIQLKSVEGGAEINTSRNSIEIIIKKNDSPVRFLQSIYLVPEEDHILIIPVVRGKDNNGNLIGSDEYEVSISYAVTTGNSTAHAQQNLDFIDLQPNTTVVFPPFIHESHLKFQIVDDTIPEIAESFHIMLLKDTLQGDAVLISPSVVQVTIKPNDKPYGVLSFNSVLFERTVIIDEDRISRYEEITVVRNGGTHGNVSANWVLTRNSTDPSPVTADIRPSSGVLHFAQGQMLATIPLTVVDDDLPEEAEAYLLQILPHTIRGGAEVSEPAELLFYIQDSDDVYGLITFFPMENQKIESSPGERYLSLSFTRLGGTKGDVRLLYSVLYIPAGAVDPLQAKEGILNISRRNDLIFPEQKTQVTTKLPIRNDAFLQNGAHFLVQLETVELLNIIPLIPPISPRFGEICNISLLVTPAIANGEIGFLSNLPIILHEPEDFAAEVVYIPLHRDGTDGQATVYWSLKPSGFNSKAVTPDDIGPFNGSVLFLSGQSDTTINITIKGDDIPEMNETVTLSLDRVNVENQVLKSGYTSRDLIILENDDPGGVFEFSPASRGPYVIKEGESVELHIIRSRGSLVKQFLHYRVEPRDSNEFYGNTGVLEFKPGEREIVITLLARLDGIPELDEHYWVVLSSHGERESKLGSATIVNITILKNDDPHGIIEFVSDGLIVMINESKGDAIYSAVYDVVRNRGNFGDVSVSWVVSPDFTQDVFPVQGTVVFGDQEFSKNITIYSLPDEIPEEMEEFTVILLNGTGGAKVGNRTTATLRIRRNDDPIYFAEPRVVRVQEGETANFTVLRNGSVDVTCMVQYATKDGKATARERDFIPVEKGETLIFEVGSRQQSISIFVNEDGIPETDEPFYIILLNSTGDTVVYQYGVATVIIEANDDPNGIFSLEPIDKAVEEGKTNAFWILRHRGYFGSVSVSWQLFQNDSALQPGQEFYETSGTVNFMDGEEAKPIILHAFPDKIPEFNEFYFLKLVNISGGSPGPGGQLAETNLQVTVMVPFNDDPFGVFILDPECLEREVAEDVLSEDDMSYITNFTILRQQGVFGDVQLGWEILSSEFPAGLPPMIDFLLVGIFPTTVHLQQHMRRHHSGTDALYFTGLEGAFGTVNPKYHPSRNNTIANFTFSAWVMPNANTNGFIIAKDDGNGSIYYGVKIQTNESHVTLSLHYKTLGSNATYIAKTTVMKYLEESVWLHLLIILEDGIIEFYLDGNAMPRGIKSLKGEAITDGPGILRIGAGINGNDRFTGLMQDVRSYERKLTLEEIYELHAMPAKSDLHPISGYLEFRQGETNKSFIISARDDNDEEGEELFILKLVSVYGGARISEENTTARLTIQKSDNANGLFGFTGACIPEIAEEGSTISCVVERTRGALDYVHVFYTISQIETDGINYLVDDFANASGTITFLPWQRSEVLNIYVLDDDIPELNEYFRVTLVSAIPGDGKLGSTPTSGASIDPEKETTDITIKASDHPYGLLQFSTGLPPQPKDAMTLPASSVPHITVEEEDGEIRLLVIRAQGLLGRVTAEFRTVSLTAFSPEDYQNVAGTLEFQPGERYKYIFINITDNSIPELEKSFKVELLNLEGGAELFRVDGSGSGDGDMEFFLPTIHKRASLGVASQILVTIAASDHAHGVFEFSPESLFVSGTEPEDGYSTVTLNVIRHHGTLSPVTLHWNIDSDPDGDLAFTSGNITFEIGQTSANITVEILPDEDPELDKAFSVSVLSVSSGSLGAHINATLTVLASDDPYGIFIFSEKNRPVKVEEATQNITLSIIRLKGLMGKVLVSYATLDDMEKPPYFPPNLARATQGRDYIPASGFALFGANQSEATIAISILDDDEPERSESVFIELLNSTLVAKVQSRSIPNSPRLGPKVETIAQLIIIANDDAFGTLQLSAPIVRVAENHVGPIINVTRTGGAFADVSVKFKAVPITAIAGEDYSIASSDVVLLEGETSKAVPIYVINDIYPELEESFLVQLMNETTGGARLGALTEAVIIIEASDDPYGLFGFQITKLIVEEPEFNSVKVNLPIIRNSGTLGNVTVQWVATINGQLATGDLRVVSGNVTFAPGETIQTLLLEVLADDVPEIEEVIQVQLTDASGGGTIGLDRIANIIIPANDDPYGTVAFAQMVYRVQEPLERSSCANITVRRSGGHFGRLLLFYSTSDIDVVALAMEEGQDLLSYYESPIQGVPDPLWRTWMNVSAVGEPLYTCATLCLKEQACSAFSFFSASEGPQCFWMTSWISPAVNNSDFWTYRKNMTRVASLFSGQAVAGSDYEPVTRQWAIMQEGDEFANLTVSILPDDFPEMDESFLISLLEVHLMNISASLKNQPTIGQPNISTVVIALNGDAFGVFVIYNISPNTSEDGLFVEVQEQPQTLVELMIHRTGGSLGQVAVEWRVVGGTATEGLDFIGAGEILTFAEGETKKTVILTILDDSEPEDDESIIVSLVYTEGGSRILPSSDTVRVNILANDNVAGIVSFQTASRSVIGHEGEILQFHVIRTFPGRGNVTVNWKIIGQNLELNFANFSGQLFFPEGSLNTTLFVHLLDDNIPEEKEVYQVILYDVRTQDSCLTFLGVPPAGIALLDAQGYAAVLTVEASDEPHGVLNFALSSRFVLLQEANITIQLFINREFGSLGAINVTYTTVPGMLSLKNQTVGNLAEPEVDFVPIIGFLILEEGETAAAINITILEDDVPELEEYFLVNLTYVGLTMAASTSFPPRLDSEGLTAQVIIDANDGARGVIEWQQSRFEVNETHGSLTLVAQRSREPLGHVSLFVYAQNLEAQVGLDYIFTPMILHFADGERYKNVNIMILDDDIPEGDEKFQLILTNPSPGLELGKNTIALIIVLANDDGPGVLSFNNSEHFFLREPTALYVQESVAVLYIVREPAQGLFGTVTVQFIVTEVNSSNESKDLTPSKGYIVLEEGVRFKALQISAILDTEPEMDEYFVCTLFNPTGGARLGVHVQTLITVLQNQAPLGLFSISAVENRATSIDIEEANRTVYLNVSRTNGIDLAVSVQWETVSETAFGMRGMDVVFSVFQSFLDESASGWCFFTLENLIYGIMLRKSSVTVYRWQGIFIPVEDLNIENPKTCEAFNIGFSPYFVITHEERNEEKPSLNSVFTFTSGFKLFLVQTIIILESSQVRYFTSDSQDYLIIASQRDDSELTQVFRWNGGSFVLHQKLPVRGVLTVALFNKGGSVFLAISQANARLNSLLFRWSGSGFINFQEVPVSGTTEVEALSSANDIYLIFAENVFLGDQNSIDIFIWEMGQSSFRYFQSVDFAAVNRIHSFTPASGIAHILLIGQDMSALYCWNSERNQFSFVLEVPSAYDVASVTVKSLNSSKNLIALVGAHSHIYELAYISSHSDFIPSSGELIFEPGEREATIAVNILDDTVPEKEESFKVQLKNPKGGAEIGINDSVTITILSNDDAYGIVAFAQNSLYKQVEEMEQDSLVTLNVERLKGTYGRITIAWEADGSISDIFPTSGVILFTEGQVLSTITLTILADNIPELSEVVIVTLTRITTEGVEDSYKGATIDQDRSKSVITTLPNDSPFGLVGWRAASVFIRVAEPKENTTTLQLQIARDKGLLGDIAIHLRAQPNFLLHVDNQATENEDYVLQETIIIMKENIKEAHAEVSILPDDLPELEEGFIVTITEVNLVNSDFSTGQPSVRRPGMEIAEIMIEENDDPRGIFMFHVTRGAGEVITAYEVPPPLNVLQVPVVRLAGSFGAVNVYWKASPDSAGLEDFKPSHGILEFADKQVTAMIEITIIDDAEFELTETFNISLISVAGGGRLGDDVVVTVVIPQNDSPFGVFGFEEKTVMIDESLSSDDPDSYVTLTVVRSPGGKGTVRLEWTIDEKAKHNLSPLNGTLHFDETESQKTIVLHTLQDTVLEEDRRFTIQLISIDEVEISPVKGSASIIIRGDKRASGEVGIAPSSRHILIGEPSAKYNGTAIISLVRGPGILGEVTVFWRIFPPSVGEFAETSGKLTMRDEQSAVIVVIQALNDDIPEEKSFYEFQLTAVSEGGVLSESSSTANITVVASDSPYGRFAFSHEQLRVSEAQRVNITIIRSSGDFGHVRLWYKTMSGTAEAGLDFVPAAGELLFEAGEMRKSLHVEILDDDYPEGPEEFSLTITKVELQGRGYDFTIQENGLQIDQPPEIGNISIVRIIIMKNDNAEGIIEFDPKYTAFEVEEDVGLIMIPVVRLHGTYGYVTADFISQSSSASPGGVDYILHGSTVTFQHGQNLSFINISIIDDNESEFEEPIEILLTGATGGAVLGRHLVSRIIIAKSDSPFGVIRFLNQSKISIANPNSTMILSLVLERTGGLLGEIQVNWETVGPNSQEALLPQNRDIADPVSGLFYFGEGEGGVRTIILTIYPHEEIEVEETFIIKLHLVKGEAKLDSRAKDVTLTIQEFGDPNGVVQFAPETLSKKTYSEPLALEGPLLITFFVRRVKGTFGEIMVYWELSSEFDITEDFLSTSGFFTIADGESEASFDVHLLPDEVPEIEEDYVIQLVSVEGGAELDLEKSITWFSVYANDDPHGVFALYSDRQSILIGQNLIRSIQINITRLAGTFGDVAVGLRISSDHKEQPIVTENAERQLVVKDGATYKVDVVPIKNQVFLSLGSNFTLQLVTVMLVGGRFYGMPTILQEAKSAVLPVSEKAANSQVGFESTAFQLMNITAGTSHVMISRRGTYGALSVAWTTGYAPGLEIPEFIVVGNMTPTLGSLSFSHGEQRKGVFLWTFPSPGWPEAFVLHLSGVQSSAPGGAQLRSGFIVAEIEPMGVFQFSTSSRNIIVSEDTQMIRLHVQRLFGFHSDLIKVSYQTTAGSAKPLEDFEPVQNGELFFQKFQTEVDFEITIINDQLSEIEEFFYINLTSVEIRGLQKFDVNWSPRLNLDFSVAVITILDNDDLAGMDISFPETTVAVAVDTTLIPVETESTTYLSTSKTTTILQPTNVVAIVTEATGVSAIPEKLVTLHGTPAVSEKPDVATVTANVSIHGTFSLGPSIVYIEEEMKNGTFNTAEVLIRRTGGFTGNVSITVKTFGERCAQMEPNALPFRGIYGISNLTWAVEEEDFEEQTLTLIFLDGERERKVSVQILDDDEPEGQEFFYVFLTNPQGGAQIVEEKDDTGFAAFAMVIITGSDLHNGIIGFSEESQSGLELREGAVMRRLHLIVTRQPNRAFEDVKVFWRVTLNKTVVVLQKDGVNLVEELQSVSGTTTCTMGQTKCFISIELKPEKVPQVEVYFFVELYEATAGAAINNSARFAQIKILESDESQSLVYFSVGSRLAVAHKKATLISLQVARDSGTGLMMSVNFSTQELRSAETIGRTIISPAISGKDFVITEGTLVFEPGQRSTVLDVILTPETGSLNSFPKRFQIVLFDPKGGARIDKVYGTANITLVSDADSQAIWGLADQLHQPVNDDILNRVLHTISMKVATENTDEQLSAMMHLIEKITTEGKIQAFSVASRTLFYEILCSLINPKRKDTRGFSHFAEVTENFAFSLLTNVTCGSPGEKSKTILDSCPYLSILALHWYPQQINGHKFEGKEGDYIRIPERLLDVQDAEIMAGKSTCKLVQFTEYSSQQWFISGNNLPTLKNKVLSLSVKGQSSQLLTNDNEVLYRIYAAEPRIIPQTSLCLLWNQAAASWLSDSQFCKVVEETADYVECACSHMSVYAVYARTDNLSSYNEAFFTSGFICISGLCLAVLSHIFCARYSMFAAKLLTHMMAASLGTQILFLASAYASPQLAEESCSAMAAVTHYLYLCQFSWMLIQSVNFWYVLVMNDEHTERRYLLFFLLSWGLPAFVVILLIVILKGIYHQSMSQIYGLIHGDLCFIPNVYAALFTAALVPLTCLVVVFVVFIHAYQVKPQWKAYDDVFRGRTNAAEIPLILYLFALISVTWLWGGLHMAYRHFWMLVLFVIFNSLQGLYVFMVYFILHNQMCCPMKASYTVEMNGHPGPSTAFFTPGSGMPPAGGEISKSTQNLIGAMEEVPPDWERASFQQGSQASPDLKPSPQNGATFPSSGGYGQGSLIADEESQEFDDLIFALKTGAGLSVSDNESGQGSQEGGTLTDSQIVELRRIPIADTHL
ncbi:adhesion G-protein coupled receptor V1 isoform X3 [Homo sapiens]|uniref:adhesion G-protein coupled receptor V1 isoform X3 n=1 Tax=Homo sapiens TaxID=9606 RepID=UPI0007DC684D|nr:adhesion G-protein coupled receptor V1 isoform X3 [Homo sapiens]|eukprot:XP_016865453.1 G-protein coupled receptor 98 isoform X2 [Homo sapiens]